MRVPSEARLPGYLAAAALLCWLPTLGWRGYWYPDEPDVALPILEMFARGDWVVPTQNGQPWLDYPPLAYWGGLFWSTLAGAPSALLLRLTPLLFGLAFVLCSARLARLLANTTAPMRGEAAATYAALLALATPLVWFQSINIHVDMGFAAAPAAGLWLYLEGDARTGWQRYHRLSASFACFGLAVLAKGPLGLLLPGFILTLWHLSYREWRRVWLLAPLTLVALAVAMVWWWPLVQRLGLPYVGQEFWLQNFDRFSHTSRGHGGKSVWFYLQNLPGDLALWCILLPPALQLAWQRRGDRRVRLLLLWCVISGIFLSLASTKRSVYLLPAYPALFALLGLWLVNRPSAAWLRALLWFAGTVFALGAAAALIGPLTHLGAQPAFAVLAGSLRWPLLGIGGLLGMGAVLALGATRNTPAAQPLTSATPEPLPRLLRGLVASAITLFLLLTAVSWWVLPVIDTVRSYQPAAAWLDAHLPAAAPIGFYVPGKETTKRSAWLCYLPGHRLEFFSDAATAQRWLSLQPGRLLLTDPEHALAFEGTQTLQQWTISTTHWTVLQARP